MYRHNALCRAFLCACRFLRKWLMLRHLPGPNQASLLRGSLASILHPHNHRIFTAWANTYGSVFRVRAVWKQVRQQDMCELG